MKWYQSIKHRNTLHNVIHITGVRMSVSSKAATWKKSIRINAQSTSPSSPSCSKPSEESGWEPKTFILPIPGKE